MVIFSEYYNWNNNIKQKVTLNESLHYKELRKGIHRSTVPIQKNYALDDCYYLIFINIYAYFEQLLFFSCKGKSDAFENIEGLIKGSPKWKTLV